MKARYRYLAVGIPTACSAAVFFVLHTTANLAAGQEQELPSLTVTLEPGGSPGDPDPIDVVMTVSGVAALADTPFLEVPIIVAGISAASYGEQDVVAIDADGPLTLSMTEDRSDATGFGQQRIFSPTRDSRGEILVRYRAKIPPPDSPRRSGPPFDLRREAGGVSGAGFGFLILPAENRPYRIGIRWALSGMAPGARGVTSLGAGDLETVGPPMVLRASFLMAGPLAAYPPDAGDLPFNAFWLGAPNFDASAVMQWTEQTYIALKGFFRDPEAPPYRVFVRKGSIPGSGGAALTNSFMIGFGTVPQSEESLNLLLAHEMVHHWIGSLDGPGGASSWFGEGLAEYYKLRVPLSAGQIDPGAFEEELSESTRRYYANKRNRIPNDSIAAEFWSESSVRNVPYDRGLLYFADLDVKVRAASRGERTVDDLVFAMLESRRQGEGYDLDAWKRIVLAELGESAAGDLEFMLGGGLIVPPTEAFGPCFTRREMSIRQYELGFTENSFLEEPRKIRGLVPGSAAAAAGLREGDPIQRRDDVDRAQTDPAQLYRLEIRRGDEIIPIEYLPRGETVTGYQWVRDPSVAPGLCGF